MKNFNKLKKKHVYSLLDFDKSVFLLKDLSLIFVEGKDSSSFLNSQLTIDILKFDRSSYKLCASCNVNGKVISIIRIFKNAKNSYGLLIKKDVCDIQINEFKKYSIFSKVSISKKFNYSVIGVKIQKDNDVLKKNFKKNLNISNFFIKKKNIFLLLPGSLMKRAIIIFMNKENENFINYILEKKIKTLPYVKWNKLDILCGIPMINIKSTCRFLPQEINLKNFFSIDFKKGCYKGQEIIAKMELRNCYKKIIVVLVGSTSCKFSFFGKIQIKIKNTFFYVGNILYFVQTKNNKFYIQAIIKRKVNVVNDFYIENDLKNKFYIKKHTFI